MQPRLLSACVAVAAASGFLLGSPRAAADSVYLTYNGPAANLPVDNSINASPTGPFLWSTTVSLPNSSFPPPTSTFCIELNQHLPPIGTMVGFGVTDLASAPTIASQTKADAITELYGRYYNKDWNQSSFTGSEDSVAFQIALWELVYDGPPSGENPTDLSNGVFYINSPSSYGYATAQTWLNSLTGDTSSFATRFPNEQLVALVAPSPGVKPLDSYQDQIAMIPIAVPAPPGVILAGIGFVGLLGSRRLRRKPIEV